MARRFLALAGLLVVALVSPAAQHGTTNGAVKGRRARGRAEASHTGPTAKVTSAFSPSHQAITSLH